jgi:hypothetical protein
MRQYNDNITTAIQGGTPISGYNLNIKVYNENIIHFIELLRTFLYTTSYDSVPPQDNPPLPQQFQTSNLGDPSLPQQFQTSNLGDPSLPQQFQTSNFSLPPHPSPSSPSSPLPRTGDSTSRMNILVSEVLTMMISDTNNHYVRERVPEQRLFLNSYNNLVNGFNENTQRYNDNISTVIEGSLPRIDYQENINAYNANIIHFIGLLRTYLLTLYNMNSPLSYLPSFEMFATYESDANASSMTPSQIDLVTEIITFRVDDANNDRVCPISLEDFIDGEELLKIRGCGHFFKKEKLRCWFSRSLFCPVCRYNVRSV